MIGTVLCARCKHLNPGEGVPTCAAFPDGIPAGIILNKLDHRKPVLGDHGIQFEENVDSPRSKSQSA